MENCEIELKLPCLIFPENDLSFNYIHKFYNYIPINSLYSNEKINLLMKEEKKCHDMILNPLQYKINKLEAWTNYITFIRKLIPKEKNDILRIFLVIEYFTKFMNKEKEFYIENSYISYWIFYIDKCRDNINILDKLFKKEICTNNFQLYITMGYIYEKYHNFNLSNEYYLKGLNSNCIGFENIRKCYNEFEKRMIDRINRELNLSIIDSDEIDQFIHEEINKLENNNDNKRKRLYSEIRNEYFEKGPQLIKMKFKIEKHKINIINEKNNIIRKGTQLVEIYNLIVQYLNNNDVNFKAINEKNLKEIINENDKKPFSWLNNKRYENQKLNYGNINLNKNIDLKNEKENKKDNQINIECINQIVNKLDKEITERKINSIDNQSKENFIKKEFKEIEEHKKIIEDLQNKINKEIEFVQKKEENLKKIMGKINNKTENNNLNLLSTKKNSQPNFNSIKPLNENIDYNLLNDKNPFYLSPIQNIDNINNNNQTNNYILSIDKHNIENNSKNNNNLSQEINKCFDFLESKKENYFKKKKRFENLFQGNDDFIDNNINDTKNNYFIEKKCNNQKDSSIEKLFNS